MKVVVASKSDIKVKAVQQALKDRGIDDAEVSGVKTVSGVPEQPMDGETETGARNRARHARQLAPDADMHVAIENGIFREDGRYIDKAVILVITRDGHEHIGYSEGVEFPKAAVEEAQRRGFDTTTAGMVMAEQKLVEKHDDPHLSLAGKPRAQILTEAVSNTLGGLLKWTGADHAASPRAVQRDRR